MQFDQLKRREFITLLGGVAAACRLRRPVRPDAPSWDISQVPRLYR